MKKQEIHLEDIQRILFGQAPPAFLIEVLVRTIIIYLILLVVMRWLGKRMAGQLTIMEMAVMVTLGAIVAVAMQVPDRGIVLSLLVLVCTILFHNGLGRLGFKNGRIEKVIQGRLSVLVEDGILQLKEMEKCRISRQQLFAQLRGKDIYNLGRVKRVYLEACGLFSIFITTESQPGLPVLPPDDKEIIKMQSPSNMLACISCGFVKDKKDEPSSCANCAHTEWIEAVVN